MIKSFKCKETEQIFKGRFSKRFPQDIQRIAARKLEMIDSATLLETLHLPPSNRLKKLKGDHSGFYSIRINDHWRICFKWKSGNAYDVEIMDYH